MLNASGLPSRGGRRVLVRLETLEMRDLLSVAVVAAPAASATAAFSVVNDWGSGFTGNVVLTNQGTSAINGWTLQFDFAAEITQIWNAKIVSHVGHRYLLQDAGYNAKLAPGQAITFGFNGAPGHVTTPPTGYLLNGIELGGGGGGGPVPSQSPPTLARAAEAATSMVTGKTVALTILGADDGGEANLTYTWTTIGTPPAPVSFSANGSNAAKATTASFSKAGVYTFQAKVVDGSGLSVVSSPVNVTVGQTLTAVVVSPGGTTIATGGTQQFTAQAIDQFNTPLASQPPFTWSIASGTGTVSSTGAYTAPGVAGTATIRATSAGLSGTSGVTVLASTSPGSAVATVVYSVASDWGSGFTGNLAITNQGTQPIQGWTLEFDLAANITQIWNAKIVSHVGDHYVVQDLGYNAKIAPGQSVSWGFNGQPGVTGPAGSPTNYVLNGIALNGPVVALPVVSIGDVTVTQPKPSDQATGVGFFQTAGNQIVDATGTAVKIAGINWFGFETGDFVPHGLWARNYQDMMNQMKQLGFNTIRMPFSNAIFNPANVPKSINFNLNPDLRGLSSLQILDQIVSYAGQIGLKLILDHHSALPDNHANESLWYIPGDANNSEQVWINHWVALAQRYVGNPTVIGADLHNEPHGPASWGDGNLATDWRLAAQRAGNAIQAVQPNWLIFVEGVETYNGQRTWWGGNLMGAGQHPVVLNVPNRVVYSPHDYPASVYNQPWFNEASYPNNLPAVWDKFWGYLYREQIAPIWLGEFGSKLQTTSDRQWYQQITTYLGNVASSHPVAGQQGMSWTWWSWNPNSSDTGGILQDDWKTADSAKVQGLIPIEFAFPAAGSPRTVTATFVVTLSAASTQTVTVAYATANGTAVAGRGYVATSGTLTFAPGQTQATVRVTVLYDPSLNQDASFQVLLSDPKNSTLGATARGTGTIRNSA